MKSLQSLNVLLIEDNPSDVLLLKTALYADPISKFVLTHVERLSDGLKQLEGETFDIVLADLGLPDSFGLDTFQRLHKQVPDMAVIVFSGNEDEEQAIRAMREGAQDYLVKSLNGFSMAARSIRHAIERQKLQSTLRESESRAQAMINAIPDLMFRVDRSGTFLDYKADVRDLHYQSESLIGKRNLDITPPEFAGMIEQKIQETLESGTTQTFEYQIEIPSIGNHAYEARMSPGGGDEVIAIVRDITERKQAEQDAIYRQELLEKVIQLGKRIAALTDLDQCLYEIYQSARFGLGFDRIGLFLYDNSVQHVLGIHGTSRTGQVEAPGFFDGPLSTFPTWQKALQSPTGVSWLEDYQKEYQLLEEDEMYGVRNHLTVAAWYGEKPVALIAADNLLTNRDIKPAEVEALQLFAGYVGLAIENATLHTELEMQVEERTNEVRDLYDNAPAGYHSVDASGKFIQINRTELTWLGYTRDEVIGHPISEFITVNSQAIFRENFPLIKERGWLRDLELEMVRKDGSIFPVLVNATAIMDPLGNFLLSRTTVFDNTERKQTEEALRESQSNLQYFFDTASDLIQSVDESGNYLYVNAAWCKTLGYTAEEAMHLTMMDVIDPGYYEHCRAMLKSLVIDQHPQQLEVIFRTRQGEEVIVEGSVSSRKDKIGHIATNGIFRNVTERKHAEEALRQSEATYRALFENANDAIFLIDLEANIQKANPQSFKLLGYSPDELIGRSSAVPLVPSDLSDSEAQWSRALVRENLPIYERRLIRKDGSMVETDINLSLIRDSAGTPMLMQCVVRDISTRKRAEDALRLANTELERAVRLKDEFLASMSHELRTPLTGILGLSEALQYDTYGELTPKQKNIIANIESSGRHLLDLINDVLDISKMEAGKFELDLVPCQLGEICQSSLQLIKGMAHKKGQDIAFSINSAHIVVKGDSRRLKQIIVNLLSNAVKYSPEKSPIGLDVVADASTQTVTIDVWDQGMGIGKDDLRRLFQPFVQLDSSLSRQQTGTGLGLALVQRLVDLHGGSIHVESAPGQGSRFTVRLPYMHENADPKEEEIADIALQIQQSSVGEDNTIDANRLTRLLRILGIQSMIQIKREGVVEKASESKPSVIMLDLNLPDTTGWDVLEKLKQNESTRDIPVVITSVVDDWERATRLGAVGYLPRLFTLEELRLTLSHIPKPASTHQDTALIATSRVSLGTVMIVDDNELNILMIEDFLRAKNYDVFSALSGTEFLARVEQVRPDIVLMDIQMPGIDGFETIQRLRVHTDPGLASVPVIAITALAMPGDRERCLDAGATEYISKPVRLKELVVTIQKILMDKEESNT